MFSCPDCGRDLSFLTDGPTIAPSGPSPVPTVPEPAGEDAPTRFPVEIVPGPDETLPGSAAGVGKGPTLPDLRDPSTRDYPAGAPGGGFADLPPGLAERFEVLAPLGAGGMGVVSLARDRRLGREVALKLIRQVNPRLARLFEQEARTLAALEHPHVVRLYEFGVEGSTPYLVMELVRGQTLHARLAGGRPRLIEAVPLAMDILSGLEACHAAGIAHLDLKPANIFLDAAGRARVADFGLSRPAAGDGAGDRGTTSGTPANISGTPGYMAPEQIRGEDPDRPADIYAFGVIFHELLTGRKLFTGRSLPEIFEQQLAGTPPAPSRTNPSVPPILDELVARAMARAPERRPGAGEIRRSLAMWLESALTRSGPRAADLGLPERPYRLLEHFRTEDAPIFFGREAETSELVDLVDSPTTRLVLVFGPCGIGKSSLLRAGLVSALDPSRYDPLVVIAGADPAATIAGALVTRAGGHELKRASGLPFTAEGVLLDPASLVDLVRAIEQHTGRSTVILMDQLEELFTLNPARTGRDVKFFQLVERLVEAPALRVKLLLSYRTEFRGHFYPLEERLSRHLRSFPLLEMAEPGLVRAIAGPSYLEPYGFRYAPGAPELLAADILSTSLQQGQSALPVAQIICHQLHERMRDKGLTEITVDLYQSSLGGAGGALTQYVENRLSSEDYGRHGGLARQILKNLTTREEGKERFASAREEEELLDFPDRAAARLTLEKLISDQLVVREDRGEGKLMVRLASEVICPLVDQWQAEPDDAERAARVLARSYRQWAEQGRSDDDLIGGAGLRHVLEQLPALRDATESERAFLDLSRARQGRRRLVASLGAIAVTSVLAWQLYLAHFQPGQLQVGSHPPGAKVFLGKELLGTSPFREPWRASPGRYSLSVEAEGHATGNLDVWIPAGGEANYQPVLRYLKGRVQIATVPSGALCELLLPSSGDRPGSLVAGLRSPVATEVTAGDYRLRVSVAGFVTTTRALHVEPDRQLTQVEVRLPSNSGALSVRSPHEGARMVVRGASGEQVWESVLPVVQPHPLPAGRYTLECSRIGSAPIAREVSIERAATTTVTVWVPPVPELWSISRPGGAATLSTLPDVDGDGLPDLVAGTFDGAYRDELVAAGASRSTDLRDGGSGSQLALMPATGDLRAPPLPVDLDEDGVLEVVVLTTGRKLRALRTSPPEILWSQDLEGTAVGRPCVVRPPSTGGPPGLAVATVEGRLRVVEGGGKSLWTVDLEGSATGGPAAADMDGDGIEDLVVAVDLDPSRGYSLSIFSGKEGKSLGRIPLPGAGGTPALADLDGDTVPDIVVGCGDPDGPGSSLVALPGRAAREGRAESLWSLSLRTRSPFSPGLADLDGDGILDVCGAYLLEPPGEGGPVLHALAVSGKSGRKLWEKLVGGRELAPPFLADLDGNGAAELVLAGSSDRVLALSGKDGQQLWERLVTNPGEDRFTGGALEISLGDLDRDGVADVVAARGDAFRHDRPSMLVAVSGAVRPALWAWEAPGVLAGRILAADLDGDTTEDLICFSAAGENQSEAPVLLAEAVSGTSGRLLWSLPRVASAAVPELALDLDGDGARDLFVPMADGSVAAISGRRGSRVWSCLPPHEVLSLEIRSGEGGPKRLLASGSSATTWLDPASGAVEGPGPSPEEDRVRATVEGPGGGKLALVSERLSSAENHVQATAREGRLVWRVPVDSPVRSLITPGDLDGDGQSDVLVETSSQGFSSLALLSGGDGRRLWTALTGMDGRPAKDLVDLDGDGTPDILVASLDRLERDPAEPAAREGIRDDRLQGLSVLSGRTGALIGSLGAFSSGDPRPVVLSPGSRDGDQPELSLVHAATRSTLVAVPLPGRLPDRPVLWPAPGLRPRSP